MPRRHAATPDVVDEEASGVPGGAAYRPARELRLAPEGERAAPRQRAMAARRGVLSPAERQTRWQVVDVSGDTTPEGFQHRLRRALGDPEAIRDARRRDVLRPVEAPEAGLVLAESGLRTTGRQAAGVARHDSGMAGTGDNGQMGGCLGDTSPLGDVRLDRVFDLPQAWSADRARGQQAGIPADRPVGHRGPGRRR